jgi:hypothetical protein
VLAELVAGGLVFTWCLPLWNETKRSYFTVYTVIVGSLFALPAWLAARAAAVPGVSVGVWSARLSLATVLVVAVTGAALFARREAAGRVLGIASVPVAIATLVVMAGAGRLGYALSLFLLLAGAAFLGATVDGLFLGHWYLTDRGLSRRPIDRITTVMLIATALAAVAVIAGGFEPAPVASDPILNPLLGAGIAPWIALGMIGATALVGVLTKAALRGQRASAVQSATGFLYLAVVTALVAEVAATTSFLPG